MEQDFFFYHRIPVWESILNSYEILYKYYENTQYT